MKEGKNERTKDWRKEKMKERNIEGMKEGKNDRKNERRKKWKKERMKERKIEGMKEGKKERMKELLTQQAEATQQGRDKTLTWLFIIRNVYNI